MTPSKAAQFANEHQVSTQFRDIVEHYNTPDR